MFYKSWYFERNKLLAKRSRQSRKEGKYIQAIERNKNGSLIRMTPMQRRKANALIHNLCCNYDNGKCIALDCDCVQCISYSVCCKWFRNAILPQDKALLAEIVYSQQSKHCAVCGKAFVPNSIRGKYCEQCSKSERKRKKAMYERKRRNKMGI